MIALAIVGPEAELYRGSEARLRGATIDVSDAAAFACAGVVFVGSQQLKTDVVERLLRAGKHVLFTAEPPESLGELEALWTVADEADVLFSAVNPDRFLPSRRLIHENAGKLGATGLIRIHRWENAATTSAVMPRAFVCDVELGLSLVGARPTHVFALASVGRRCLHVHLGFTDGAMALLDYAGTLPPGDAYQSLTAIGASGAAYADDHDNVQLAYRGGRPVGIHANETARQRASLLQDFVDALTGGRDRSAGRTLWRDVFMTLDAIERSLARGEAVLLEER